MPSVPSWFPRVRVRAGSLGPVRELVSELGLHTVCEGALCPNRPDCYTQRHVTVLILGNTCTRDCGFCAVAHGQPLAVDPSEPAKVAEMARRLAMRHVVVTSVTRDDLPDGGASQYVAVASELAALPDPPTSEALVPDFKGALAPIEAVARSPYRVFAHNLETVRRLYPIARPQADYDRSLTVLETFRRLAPAKVVKSGLMLGLGEEQEEILQALEDLRRAGVSALALGQYLQPTPSEVEVARFLRPEEFERLGEEARALGFDFVAAGPYVRSSYRAAEALATQTSPSA